LKGKVKLSCIVLTWNSISYIEGCLNSIDKLKSIVDLELVIVDNGSTDGTINKLFELKSFINYDVEIISLNKNLGTTITRNMAIKKCNGDMLAFIDSDVEFDKEGFLEMVDYLNNNEDIGILAPMIKYPDGSIQQSCKKFPTIDVKFLKLIDIFTFFNSGNRDYYVDFPFDAPCIVDTAISAFWLMNRKNIDLVGYFDENIFYSPEDVDYCLRVWLEGKKVCFYPDFTIYHHVQQITHKFPFKIISLTHLRDLFYYFNKHKYFFSNKKINNKINSNKAAP
jgi:GT2 family glycosyltransferase